MIVFLFCDLEKSWGWIHIKKFYHRWELDQLPVNVYFCNKSVFQVHSNHRSKCKQPLLLMQPAQI